MAALTRGGGGVVGGGEGEQPDQRTQTPGRMLREIKKREKEEFAHKNRSPRRLAIYGVPGTSEGYPLRTTPLAEEMAAAGGPLPPSPGGSAPGHGAGAGAVAVHGRRRGGRASWPPERGAAAAAMTQSRPGPALPPARSLLPSPLLPPPPDPPAGEGY